MISMVVILLVLLTYVPMYLISSYCDQENDSVFLVGIVKILQFIQMRESAILLFD